MPGEPPILKTRMHLRKDAAEQLWKGLRRVGWIRLILAGAPLLSRKAKGLWGKPGPRTNAMTAQKFFIFLESMRRHNYSSPPIGCFDHI